MREEPVPGCSREVREDSFVRELKSKMDYLSVFKPVPTACSSTLRMEISSASTPADSSSRSSGGEPKIKRTKRGGRKHKNKPNNLEDEAKNLTPEQVSAERSERLQALSRSDGAAYDEEFCRIFINNTVDSNPNGNFMLFIQHFAAPNSDTDLDRLIKSGAYDDVQAGSVDVTGRDDIGMTLLHRAIRNGRHHLVSRLLRFGFDINAKTDYMVTPLMLAAIGGHYHIVKLLIQAKADLHCTVSSGMNALHYAALYKHFDVVKLLIGSGMNPNVQDSKRETALHKAAMSHDNFAVVSFLVGVGADLHALNNLNYKPLNLAIFAKHDETINYLTTMTLAEAEYHSS